MPTVPPLSLRESRRAARLSQDELAIRSGVDRSLLSRAERGYVRLRPEVYSRLVDLCEAAIDDGSNATSAQAGSPS